MICFALFYFLEVEEWNKEALSIISKDQTIEETPYSGPEPSISLFLHQRNSFIQIPSVPAQPHCPRAPSFMPKKSPMGCVQLVSHIEALKAPPRPPPCKLQMHLDFETLSGSSQAVSCSLLQALVIFCSFFSCSSCGYFPMICFCVCLSY